MRIAILAIPVLLLGAAAPAPQSGGGWQMWEYRADRVIDAIDNANLNMLDVQCSGVRDVLNKSGFQFPVWAQGLRTACAAARNVFEPVDSLRRVRIVCRDLKAAAKQLARAREVPEAPEADNRARRLSALLLHVRDMACK
ncbi:hypothetical protein P1X14_20900 [Sphingomonas sp. AOB5]|uniref:hypothetical protein n=1 Tax=Sphingomonas sp. AOB5 TaxID=3034017 RepID=UPI0023F9F02C|nr:hypothetical protein [Sphingomonas sp. AOB5]MDF7777727.1 hypothetical protein [Sphingomonas sp. AOB5]